MRIVSVAHDGRTAVVGGRCPAQRHLLVAGRSAQARRRVRHRDRGRRRGGAVDRRPRAGTGGVVRPHPVVLRRAGRKTGVAVCDAGEAAAAEIGPARGAVVRHLQLSS